LALHQPNYCRASTKADVIIMKQTEPVSYWVSAKQL
jgi:hypothetical protein